MSQARTYIVSGASQGIGLETVRNLVGMGHRVILIARNDEKVDQAIDSIRSTHRNGLVEGFAADMSLQQDIRNVANEITSRYPVIDGLINNVGTWMSNYTLTKEGVETVFATNHLSYVLMTHMIYPALRNSDHARVINVASNAHSYGKINLDDPGYSKNYHGLKSNGQSKLANLYFTFELDKLKPDPHVSVYAVSPGLVKTDIGLKHTSWLHTVAWKFRRRKGQHPSEGSRTSVFCAVDPHIHSNSGMYWESCKVKEVFKSARDPHLGSQLWEVSNQILGIEDYFHEREM